MTRQTQAPAGLPPYGVPVPEAVTQGRSGELDEETAQTGPRTAGPWPPGAQQPQPAAPAEPTRRAAGRAAASRARRDRSTIGVVPYLGVLVCTVAGVYIAWRQGSAGGGRGGVVAGGALLVAAVVRLALPDRLAGLLASRRRATDVIVLIVFGAGLLVAGLVLPRLGPLSVQGRMAGPPMKGKDG